MNTNTTNGTADVYRNIWQTYLDAATAFVAGIKKARQIEKEANPDKEGWSLCIKEIDTNILDQARNLVQSMVWNAQRTFAPQGARLEIPEHEIKKRFLPYRNENEDEALAAFDPGKVWEYLEATYGGDKGKDEAYRQAASVLLRGLFGIRRGEPAGLVRKGGYLVADITVWTEENFRGRKKLSYSCENHIQESLKALRACARWAGRTMLPAGIDTILNNHPAFGGVHNSDGGIDHRITSREKIALGDQNTELVIVTYFNRFEFRFREDFGQQVQIFLAKYAPNDERMAA